MQGLVRASGALLALWAPHGLAVTLSRGGSNDGTIAEFVLDRSDPEEGTKHVRVWDSFPDGSIRPVPAPGTQRKKGAPCTMSEACEAACRNETTLKFIQSFTQNYEDRVQSAFAHITHSPMLTVSEWRNSAYLRNFVTHMREVAQRDSHNMTIINVALDAKGFAACERIQWAISSAFLELTCVDISGWLPADFFATEASSGPMFLTCDYNVIIWSKPVILLAALQASAHGILMIDTDVIAYRDPVAYAQEVIADQAGAHLAVAREHGPNGDKWTVNTGLVYATKDAEDLVKTWVDMDGDFLNTPYGDQGALQALIRERWYIRYKREDISGIRHRVAKFPQSAVEQCGNPAEVASHYNCYKSKKWALLKAGYWAFGDRSGLYTDAQLQKPFRPATAGTLKYYKLDERWEPSHVESGLALKPDWARHVEDFLRENRGIGRATDKSIKFAEHHQFEGVYGRSIRALDGRVAVCWGAERDVDAAHPCGTSNMVYVVAVPDDDNVSWRAARCWFDAPTYQGPRPVIGELKSLASQIWDVFYLAEERS